MTFLLTIAEPDEKMCRAAIYVAHNPTLGDDIADWRSILQAALSASPPICSDYWKAMREEVEAGERLVGCEIVSISWANAYDALKAAQARRRSLEDKAGETP